MTSIQAARLHRFSVRRGLASAAAGATLLGTAVLAGGFAEIPAGSHNAGASVTFAEATSYSGREAGIAAAPISDTRHTSRIDHVTGLEHLLSLPVWIPEPPTAPTAPQSAPAAPAQASSAPAMQEPAASPTAPVESRVLVLDQTEQWADDDGDAAPDSEQHDSAGRSAAGDADRVQYDQIDLRGDMQGSEVGDSVNSSTSQVPAGSIQSSEIACELTDDSSPVAGGVR